LGALRRADTWPLDQFAIVEPAWVGATVVCIAGGPSLTAHQVELVQAWRQGDRAGAPRRVIVVNDAYQLAPFADLLFFADSRWWGWHRARPALKAFVGDKVTMGFNGEWIPDEAVWKLRDIASPESERVLSTTPNALAKGGSSGYQAMNLAVLAGAARLVLLGYDCKVAADRRMHWFGDHPIPTPPWWLSTLPRLFAQLAKALAARGVEVVNCSEDTALGCFPRAPLDRALGF